MLTYIHYVFLCQVSWTAEHLKLEVLVGWKLPQLCISTRTKRCGFKLLVLYAPYLWQWAGVELQSCYKQTVGLKIALSPERFSVCLVFVDIARLTQLTDPWLFGVWSVRECGGGFISSKMSAESFCFLRMFVNTFHWHFIGRRPRRAVLAKGNLLWLDQGIDLSIM